MLIFVQFCCYIYCFVSFYFYVHLFTLFKYCTALRCPPACLLSFFPSFLLSFFPSFFFAYSVICTLLPLLCNSLIVLYNNVRVRVCVHYIVFI
nr:MAG TPA: hypothetical protein [Bacteriophage sp.]